MNCVAFETYRIHVIQYTPNFQRMFCFEMAQDNFGYFQIFVLIVYAISQVSTAYGKTPIKKWCGVVDVALVDMNFLSTTTTNQKLCHLACMDSPNCQSSNYWSKTHLCEFNNASHFNVCDRHLIKQQGSIYTFTEAEVCMVFCLLACIWVLFLAVTIPIYLISIHYTNCVDFVYAYIRGGSRSFEGRGPNGWNYCLICMT